MNDPRGFPRFSIGRRRLLTYAVSSPVMPIVAGFGVNLATPSSAVAADPQIRWSAHMESGTLLPNDTPPGEWDERVNDPGCDTVAIGIDGAVQPHGGNYMMKQTVPAEGGGTRMQRYPEVDNLSRTRTTYYYSFYHYLPEAITYGIFDTYIVWGLLSKGDPSSFGNPFWSLVLASSSNNGTGALDLIWSPNNQAPSGGPHQSDPSGYPNKHTYAGLAANRLPIGQWNFIEIMITPADDFTGAIKIWQNGTLIHDQSPTSANGLGGVKTQWPNTIPPDELFTWLEQTGYGSGLTPTPTINYVDDVTISLARVPFWSAGMEYGDLSEWLYVMKQAVTAPPGATRMQRYPEVDQLARAGTKFYWSWYDYFPTPISFGISEMFQIWGSMSIRTNGLNDPSDVFFSFGFTPTGNLLRLTYNPTGRAQTTPKAEYTNSTPVPVGLWNFFEIEFLPRGDATGSLRLWMNGALQFALFNIQTQYPLIGQNPLLTVIEQTGYGDVAATHYVDDVTISFERMG